MQLYYRILSIDPTEGSVVVRYYTDEISERELRTTPEEDVAKPTRCRTDSNLTIWNPGITAEELHEQIRRSAPVKWLMLREAIKDPNVDTSLSEVTPLIGQEFAVNVLPSGVIDAS